MKDGDLSSLESELGKMFQRLGLPDPVVLSRVIAEWDELAGEPWKGRSKPLAFEDRTLIVEASAPSAVAFLRYGESTLLQRIGEAIGEGVIERIEVRAPRIR